MPCHNRAVDLRRVLSGYASQIGDLPFEVIAIDDASTDATPIVLSECRSMRFELRMVRLATGRGPAAARNKGIDLARGEFIAFVGDDILPARDFVLRHANALQSRSRSRVAILGHVAWPGDMPVNAVMRHIDGMGAEQFSYRFLKHGECYDFRHFYTANISISRDTISGVRFDETFNFAAYEDAELAYRLYGTAPEIVYDATIEGRHYHFHTCWSFAKRQQRCGQMAVHFLKLHPGARSFVIPGYYDKWLHQSKLFADSPIPYESLALQRASEIEWGHAEQHQPFLTRLFRYFYCKGIAEATLQDKNQERTIRRLAHLALRDFIPLN
jgi:glycosyltransferase involved in cell wall biosynthesis